MGRRNPNKTNNRDFIVNYQPIFSLNFLITKLSLVTSIGISAMGILLNSCLPAFGEDQTILVRQLIQTHCKVCHGSKGRTEADIDLTGLKNDSDFAASPDLIENLISVLTDQTMPPEDKLQPKPELREAGIKILKSVLNESAQNTPFLPTPIRRMNRFQYNNAVVDLLGLDRDIFQMNERLMRRRSDYFHPASRKMPDLVNVSSRPLSKDIDNQRPEGFKGVAAFPQDKRAENGFDNRGDHLTLSPLLMESFLTLSRSIVESPDLNSRECRDWDRLFSPPEKPARADLKGRYEAELGGSIKTVSNSGGALNPQKLLPRGNTKWSRNTHLFWQCPDQGQELTLSFHAKHAGTGLKLALTKAPDYGVFEILINGKKVGPSIDLYDPKIARTIVDIDKLDIQPGPIEIKFRSLPKSGKSKGFYFGLDFVDIIKTNASRKKPQKPVSREDVVKERLNWFLRKAFRQPVDPLTLKRFEEFAKKQLASGASMEETMRNVVGAVITMPDFLYLYETQSTQAPADQKIRRRISDHELATRLSQFFWSSIPDDTLLDLAGEGKLSDPQMLSQQVDRMLNDPRTARFCDNFPAQWLQLERLITSIPEKKKFPFFYIAGYRSSMHMMSEPLLLFETVFVEDRSVLDLISPDFTWQSDLLRQNYLGKSNAGIAVQVQQFKRVPVTDPRRGGVITNAAIMTMTSTPTRTQPISRGAWINTVIFNDPPEPPPADVPPLPEDNKEDLEKLTIRERLAAHRKRADCAGCHNKIDPLGFALENFGPTGIWRDKYENGRDVDMSGTLFNRHDFQNITEFKQLILKEKNRFYRAFAAHVLSYALARELGPADSPALDKMTRQALAGEDSMRSFMKNIALSEPFLHKR